MAYIVMALHTGLLKGSNGELYYLGIIDILTKYKFKKQAPFQSST